MIPEWTHPINPQEIRRAEDGRVAFLMLFRDGYEPGNEVGRKWISLSAPGGAVQIAALEPEDVADWKILTTD